MSFLKSRKPHAGLLEREVKTSRPTRRKGPLKAAYGGQQDVGDEGGHVGFRLMKARMSTVGLVSGRQSPRVPLRGASRFGDGRKSGIFTGAHIAHTGVGRRPACSPIGECQTDRPECCVYACRPTNGTPDDDHPDPDRLHHDPAYDRRSFHHVQPGDRRTDREGTQERPGRHPINAHRTRKRCG